MPVLTSCFYWFVSLQPRAFQQIPLQVCKKWGKERPMGENEEVLSLTVSGEIIDKVISTVQAACA
jgi:hypothetical protein